MAEVRARLGPEPLAVRSQERAGEQALVHRASRGDRSAFAELVRAHQGRVRGLLLRLTQDATWADDLAQEVFIRAYRALLSFEGRASFSTWLYRIAYNLFLNHRARTRQPAGLPEGYETRAAAPDGPASAPRADMRRDLAAAIDQLPERYRAVVLLYYIEDVSYPEIAEVLDLPLGTVKTHLHRARLLLRGHLHGWGTSVETGTFDD